MINRLLVFAPTRRAASETFVRANLEGLPCEVIAYFGDERPLMEPRRLAYGLAVLLSKVLTRFGCLRLAGWPAATVAQRLIQRHQPDLVMAEFGFHAVRLAIIHDVPRLVTGPRRDAHSVQKHVGGGVGA